MQTDRIVSKEEREKLRAFLNLLEVPDCKCKPSLIPLCKWSTGESCAKPECITWERPDGCKRRRRDDKCDCPLTVCECPVLPGPPCPHVLSVLDKWPKIDGEPITFEQWLALLRVPEQVDPPLILEPEDGGYGDRRLPPAASRAKLHAAHVDEYAGRFSNGFSLWHPDDVWRENGRALQPTLSKVNVQGGKHKVETGHAVVRHSAPPKEVPLGGK